MHQLREQCDPSYRGQVSQMVAPVQEIPKPVQPYRLGVDQREAAELTQRIRDMLAGEKLVTVPMNDPRVAAIVPQLCRAKMRIVLCVREALAVSFNYAANTVFFANVAV